MSFSLKSAVSELFFEHFYYFSDHSGMGLRLAQTSRVAQITMQALHEVFKIGPKAR